MDRFVRTMLSALPPLSEIEARYGTDYVRLSGALSALYDAARSALCQVSQRTDPEEEDDEAEDTPTYIPAPDTRDDPTTPHETGDPGAVDDETVDYGSMPNIRADSTRHDWRELMKAPTEATR